MAFDPWRAIDLYCERTGPEFWSEPVNALSNAAFLVAGALLLARWRVLPPSLRVLALLVVAIGAGSFLLHTFAQAWAALADMLPILAFMHWYAACFARWMLGLPWRRAWLGIPAFFLWLWALGLVLPAIGGYLPALAALVAFAGILAVRRDAAARRYLVVAGVFAVSLALRQLDARVCEAFPPGTHFLWHCLNALTLCLATLILADRAAPPTAAPASPACRRH